MCDIIFMLVRIIILTYSSKYLCFFSDVVNINNLCLHGIRTIHTVDDIGVLYFFALLLFMNTYI